MFRYAVQHCSLKDNDNITAPEPPRERSQWLVIAILLAMSLLALGNMFLFLKLWRLEQQSSDHKTPLLDTPAVR